MSIDLSVRVCIVRLASQIGQMATAFGHKYGPKKTVFREFNLRYIIYMLSVGLLSERAISCGYVGVLKTLKALKTAENHQSARFPHMRFPPYAFSPI